MSIFFHFGDLTLFQDILLFNDILFHVNIIERRTVLPFSLFNISNQKLMLTFTLCVFTQIFSNIFIIVTALSLKRTNVDKSHYNQNYTKVAVFDKIMQNILSYFVH